ncbi:uncharacterized protein BT62DRAFT_1004575 [Guyanagaster necrorhizus]|uniref:Uncharacterized protein n=1 Tax=Guyanagaster necrorhizus TaxID=856835 RepID=A0A9P8ATU8_9AGAR|nr:uncharacterized protein BT62DRAFT_1004575 [Guyanagaster necrorhizus MCA 3950]KAG7447813.1 hypothetical protein BT62DRAFT_1004575 [Guyanagaster necrorhizus MCA 3950]
MALLLTSTAVQTVVTNTIILVQEVITEFAGSVSDVPRQVQGVAEGVEKKLDAEVDVPPYPTSRIYPLSSKRRIQRTTKLTLRTSAPMMPRRQTDSAAEGIQAILAEAHRDARYIAALKVLLSLFEKCLSIHLAVPGGHAVVAQCSVPQVQVHRAADAKTLLQRLVSGKSLDPLCASFNNLVAAVASVPREDHAVVQLHAYFTELRGCLALASLPEDHTTVRLLRILTTLSTDIHDYLSSVRSPLRKRRTLLFGSDLERRRRRRGRHERIAFFSLMRTIFKPDGAVIIPTLIFISTAFLRERYIVFGRSGGIPSLGHEDEGVLGLDFGLGGLGGAIIGILLCLHEFTPLMDLKHWILILNEPAYADHPASGQVVRTKGAKRRLVEQWQSMAWLGLAWLMTCTLSKVKRKKGRGGQSWWTAIMNVIASGQLFGRSPQLTDQIAWKQTLHAEERPVDVEQRVREEVDAVGELIDSNRRQTCARAESRGKGTPCGGGGLPETMCTQPEGGSELPGEVLDKTCVGLGPGSRR